MGTPNSDTDTVPEPAVVDTATASTEAVLAEITRFAEAIPKQDQQIAETDRANDALELKAVEDALERLKPVLRHIATDSLGKRTNEHGHEKSLMCAVVALGGEAGGDRGRYQLLIARDGKFWRSSEKVQACTEIDVKNAISCYNLRNVLSGLLKLLRNRSQRLAQRQKTLDARHRTIVESIQGAIADATAEETTD